MGWILVEKLGSVALAGVCSIYFHHGEEEEEGSPHYDARQAPDWPKDDPYLVFI